MVREPKIIALPARWQGLGRMILDLGLRGAGDSPRLWVEWRREKWTIALFHLTEVVQESQVCFFCFFPTREWAIGAKFGMLRGGVRKPRGCIVIPIANTIFTGYIIPLWI